MKIPPFPRRPLRLQRGGFSLVEVTLSIGIVAFAFIALFGLLPTGLNVFRAAIDASIGSQILQQVTQAAQQTDYEQLTTTPNNDTYYDEQGNLLVNSDGTPSTDSRDPRSVYTVRYDAKAPTSIPAKGGSGGSNTTANVATLTVKIAKNPGHNQTPFTDANRANVNVYVAYVARNKSAFESQ